MLFQRMSFMACWTLALAGSFSVAAAEELLFTAGERLTAEDLVAAVFHRNAGLDEVRAAVEAAEASVEPAGALDDPMLSLTAAPGTFGSELGGRGEVQISQAIPWWGTLDARKDAARANADAVEEDVATLKLRLAAATQSAFADWHYIHRALAINESNRLLLTDLRDVAQARYAAGRAMQQDVLQANVERTLLDQQALELDRERTVIQARINALLNRPPATSLPPPEDLSSDIELPPLSEIESFALAHHPLVRQMEFKQLAASAEITIAEKERYPEFRITAGYNSLWENVDVRPMIGVSITVPLNQSKRNAEIDGARAQLRRSGYALENLQATLAGNLAAVYAAADEARQSSILFRDEVLPLAEDTLVVARSDYGAGEGDFLNVIAAERNLLDIRLRLAHSEATFFQRVAELGHLAGSSYPFDLSTSGDGFETEAISHD